MRGGGAWHADGGGGGGGGGGWVMASSSKFTGILEDYCVSHFNTEGHRRSSNKLST